MTTFGFSAFLKLIHLNERPRRTELRKRLRGYSQGGYDYHRSLRAFSRKLVLDRHGLASVMLEAEAISNTAERNSARSGLAMLENWRVANVLDSFPAEQVTIESPGNIYKVCYRPDFGVDIAGVRTAVHVWNTIRPDLQRRMVLAAMAPFFDQVAGQGYNQIAVLSLRDGQLYGLTDAAPYLAHSNVLFEYIDRLIEEIDDDGRRPPAEDRPTA
ncbi:hypothetical protein [Devosia riboflavina]